MPIMSIFRYQVPVKSVQITLKRDEKVMKKLHDEHTDTVKASFEMLMEEESMGPLYVSVYICGRIYSTSLQHLRTSHY